jgi:hypothetical protein
MRASFACGPLVACLLAPLLAATLALVQPAGAAPPGKDPKSQVRDALAFLDRSASGHRLLERACGFWKEPSLDALASHFEAGPASRTDAILTRKYNPATGRESRERQVSVVVRTDQPLEEIVLDLAHELVHALARPSWDPYDPRLTPGAYIRATIEGQGGEIDAVVSECNVARELRLKGTFGRAQASLERCLAYWSPRGIRRSRVRKDFYRVGDWKSPLTKLLGPEAEGFPFLSTERPRLYSSTGSAPYPMALYREYEEITQVACENSRKRLEELGKRGRNPASGSRAETQEFLQLRCNLGAPLPWHPGRLFERDPAADRRYPLGIPRKFRWDPPKGEGHARPAVLDADNVAKIRLLNERSFHAVSAVVGGVGVRSRAGGESREPG